MQRETNSTSRIRDEVLTYIQREILSPDDAAELTEATPLITSGVLDSISTVKLVAHLEERYGIEFDAFEIDIDYMNTVTDLARLIQSKLAIA